MSFADLIQQVLNGISLGGLYALVAIGYTLVYGIIRLINFAHGDLLMVGAYSALLLLMGVHLPWSVSIVLAVLITCLTAIVMERIAYRPLRYAPRISLLITAIGVSFFLESGGTVLFTGVPRSYSPVIPEGWRGQWKIGELTFPALSVITIILTVVALGVTFWVIFQTKTGLAMRAIAKDFETTMLMGVDADRVIVITFALGSVLAAIGGILWAMRFPQIFPLMGILPGLKAFIAAVLGGIGNVLGAALGGFLLGILEILIPAFLPGLSGYRDAISFFILIIILLWKPKGLLGSTVE
ncbi:MAG: branched-chain amino acid ABC transporter permease [bacterium JZ-2024 1]